MTSPHEYVRAHSAGFEEELNELLRIPSVSTLPAHRADMLRAARWLVDHLRHIGMEAELAEEGKTGAAREFSPGEGHPLVYAEWLGAPGRPTILGYGHYDVQPVDPLAEWISPPFEPTVRDGNLYARGAADDKGQILTLIKAVQAYLATKRPLPVNVKLLIEGEEETGGTTVERYVRANRARLGADAALVLDSGMFAPEIPAITLGLRGIVTAEIEVSGAARDLHSGRYGGAAPNPFLALAQILTGLRDARDRVLIPGFYERVVPPDPEERSAWSRLEFDEGEFLRDEVGSPALGGELEFPVLERIWARPTLEVHGMPGGFTGEGTKTVIPARAAAKVSMRLVPRQDPDEIYKLFEAHVKRLQPRGTRVAVRRSGYLTPAVVMDPRSPAMTAARAAFTETFGHETVLIRAGGSIPVVTHFTGLLGLPTVVTGWTLSDSNLHSPNEKLHLGHFHRGIDAVIRFFGRFGATADS